MWPHVKQQKGLEWIKYSKKKLINLAYQAGEMMLETRKKNKIKIKIKEDKSLVTEADLLIQKFLEHELAKLIPEAILIGEENFSEENLKKAEKSKFVWIFDPIDGTSCFINKDCKEYGVGIALLEDKIPKVSLFYAPELDLDGSGKSLFFASSSKDKAFLNGKELFSSNQENLNQLSHYLLLGEKFPKEHFETSIENHFKRETPDKKLASLARFSMLASTEKYPAEYKVVIFRKPKIWDIVTAAFIVEKSGGIVTYENGHPILPLDFNLITTVDKSPRIPTVLGAPASLKNQVLALLQ